MERLILREDSKKAVTSYNTIFTHRDDFVAPRSGTKLEEDSERYFSIGEAGAAGHIRTD